MAKEKADQPPPEGKVEGWYPDVSNPDDELRWDGRAWAIRRRRNGEGWIYLPVQEPGTTQSSRRVSGNLSHRTLVVSVFVAVLLIGVVIGIFLSRATSAPTLTLQQARQAFSATWPGFANGFATGNATELNDFGTQEMVQAVVGWYNCGCGQWLAHDTALHLSVPVEHSYPLSFLAEVSTPDAKPGPTVQEVVLSKANGADPWRVAYMVAYTGTSTYLGPSSVQSAPRVPFKIGSQLASFFESIVNTGVPPADDLNIPVTGSVKDELDRYASVVQSIELSGDVQHITFQPADHSTSFAYPGGDILCGAIHSNQVVTAPPGSPIVQPTDRSNYGPLLLPGSYSSVTKSGTHDYCVTVTTASVVTPVSFFGGVYQSVGQP